MLKCPFHLPYLTELSDTFKDSVIVWTHRDPRDCIASACSLYETLSSPLLESSTIDRKLLRKAVLNYTKLAFEKAFKSIEQIEKGKKNKIVHVSYPKLISNSVDVCKTVFKSANMEFSTEYENKINDYNKASDEKRKALKKISTKGGNSEKLHDYSLEDYGLTNDEVYNTFKYYIDKFELDKKK